MRHIKLVVFLAIVVIGPAQLAERNATSGDVKAFAATQMKTHP